MRSQNFSDAEICPIARASNVPSCWRACCCSRHIGPGTSVIIHTDAQYCKFLRRCLTQKQECLSRYERLLLAVRHEGFRSLPDACPKKFARAPPQLILNGCLEDREVLPEVCDDGCCSALPRSKRPPELPPRSSGVCNIRQQSKAGPTQMS